jgi:hypothetical protein
VLDEHLATGIKLVDPKGGTHPLIRLALQNRSTRGLIAWVDLRLVDRCKRRVRVASVPVALFDVVPSVGESLQFPKLSAKPMTSSDYLKLRGRTYYVRVQIPRDLWAAAGGKREYVKNAQDRGLQRSQQAEARPRRGIPKAH